MVCFFCAEHQSGRNACRSLTCFKIMMTEISASVHQNIFAVSIIISDGVLTLPSISLVLILHLIINIYYFNVRSDIIKIGVNTQLEILTNTESWRNIGAFFEQLSAVCEELADLLRPLLITNQKQHSYSATDEQCAQDYKYFLCKKKYFFIGLCSIYAFLGSNCIKIYKKSRFQNLSNYKLQSIIVIFISITFCCACTKNN